MRIKHIIITAALSSVVLLTGCETTDIQNIASQGSAVSTESHKAINEESVKIYYGNQGLPKHYRVIGRVSAETYNLVGLEHTQSTIAQELKKQAASIGANGVINIATSMTQTTGDAIVVK